MKKNNNNNVVAYTFLIAVVVLLIVAGAHYGFLGSQGLKKASVVNSVSTINYASNSGNVQNGQLSGAKMQFATTLTPEPLDAVFNLAQTDQTWGSYKITPQDNLRLKLSATGSAEALTTLYRLSYYKDSSGNVVQTTDLKGSGVWQILTPTHIEIYADQSARPTTLVLSKDIAGSDLQGQQFVAIGNGVNIQRSSIAQTGNNALPDLSNIVVATAPSLTGIQGANIVPDYAPGTFIFDKGSYDAAVQKFYNQAGGSGSWVGRLQNPQQALWTGYDTFSWSLSSLCGRFSSAYVNGYCKLSNWDGLYKEASRLTYPMQFDPSTQKLTAPNINFGANMNLEIPSEVVKSYAILRGVGVADFTYTMSQNIQEGNRLSVVVTVTNKGDTDGFNVWVTSSSGKLIFSPPSYSSQYFSAGQTKTFQFVETVAGKTTSLPLSATETVVVDVQPEHGQKVEKSQSVAIGYNAISSTQSDKTSQQQQQQGTFTGTNTQPSTGDTMKDLTKNTYNNTAKYRAVFIKWYEQPIAVLLVFLVAALLIVAVASRRLNG